MDAKTLLKERTELFDNVFAHKHNKRAPLLSNTSFWPAQDCGYKLTESQTNRTISEEINDVFHERYQFDAYQSLFGTLSPMNIAQVLGGGVYRANETDDALIVDDHCIMERSEYKLLRENPMEFYWTKTFPRIAKPGLTMAELEQAMQLFLANSAFSAKMRDKYTNQYGALMDSVSGVLMPLEFIFMQLRGIKNTSLDIRKCKDEMKATMDAIFQTACVPSMQMGLGKDSTGYLGDMKIYFLAHSILSEKQFEELYWPYLKQTLDFAVANNLKVVLYCEHMILRFADFFQEIPKGVALAQIEQDNIFEVREKLPNLALAGGMPLDLLGYGTKQECIDYARKLIDTLGDGYAWSTEKLLAYKNDAKRENLMAVTEFVRNYNY